MARDLVLEDYPEAVIEIVDPKAAGIGEGYLVMRAVAARDAGRSLAEAKEEIMDLAPKLRTYFLVDDLYHLMRGGRLSKSAAIMGSLAASNPFSGLMRKENWSQLARFGDAKKLSGNYWS